VPHWIFPLSDKQASFSLSFLFSPPFYIWVRLSLPH
jgi:hypothetical protein